MGYALKAWIEASKARIETLLVRAEKYTTRTSSEATSVGYYSIT